MAEGVEEADGSGELLVVLVAEVEIEALGLNGDTAVADEIEAGVDQLRVRSNSWLTAVGGAVIVQ